MTGDQVGHKQAFGVWVEIEAKSSLAGADLQGRSFRGADLRQADLRDADLRGADLTGANLSNAELDGALLSGVRLGDTVLAATNLTPFCVASGIVHASPSAVDWTALALSIDAPGLESFLIAAGMPDYYAMYAIDTLRASDPENRQRLSRPTMISFGEADGAFVTHLHERLLLHGVGARFFPLYAKSGENAKHMLRDTRDRFERVIFVCSHSLLRRPGFWAEVAFVLGEEARRGRSDMLIPITLDGAIYQDDWAPHRPDLIRTLRNRLAIDFRGAKRDDAVFDRCYERILALLRAS